ncbi:hypothetical protein KUTG_01257 [Kutzneria sp. 744]|nr:hypothetical protein KUTG_01257 [Kutzneria sp. 744]
MAFSAIVVAVCAVVLTVKVMSTDTVTVKPVRVLDPAAVEKQVANTVGETKNGPPRVYCPVSVVVEVGAKFECRAWGNTNPETYEVKILDDQGELSIEKQ